MKTKEKESRPFLTKTVRLSLVCFIWMCIAIIVGFGNPGPVDDEEGKVNPWTLIRKEEGITVYQRWIKLPGNRDGRQLYVDFLIHDTISGIRKALCDAESAMEWMTGIKEFSLVQKTDTSTWYVYLLYDIPWPLRKQDLIVRYRLSVPDTEGSFRLEMTGCPDFLPENKGITRVTHMEGTWVISREGPESTRVQYFLFSAQRSSLPKWLTDPIIQSNLINTMRNLRDFVLREQVSRNLHTQIINQ